MHLTPVQARIVGCLIEKEMATPDNYPLTMNGLLAACNQTSNRNPVTRLDEATVGNALENLRAMQVVRIVYSRSNRADKFRHVLDEVLALEPAELAVLSVLMLRGPQTASELRTRTERLHPFADLGEVEEALHRMAGRQESLAARLERQPGQKESRWAHLIGGDLTEALAGADTPPLRAAIDEDGPPAEGRAPRADRLAELEAAVTGLRSEVDGLRSELGELRAELEGLRKAHTDLVTLLGDIDD